MLKLPGFDVDPCVGDDASFSGCAGVGTGASFSDCSGVGAGASSDVDACVEADVSVDVAGSVRARSGFDAASCFAADVCDVGGVGLTVLTDEFSFALFKLDPCFCCRSPTTSTALSGVHRSCIAFICNSLLLMLNANSPRVNTPFMEVNSA